jgi:drug efflux transport system permease protein
MKLRQAFSRIGHMVTKEFIQTLRDPRTRWVLIGPPIIQMLIFGYAATLEVKHVSLAVLDLDRTPASRELISRFSGSQYFTLEKYADRPEELRDGIERGDYLMALRIDAGFAQRLRNGQGASVQVLVDASNSNTALVGLGYLNQIGLQFAQDYQRDRIERTSPQLVAFLPRVELQARPWFNEGLDSQWYFVPGVVGNLMLIMVMTVTAFAVVREREIGTLEQIMVTPIRRWEFILGKTVPFFLIGCFEATMLAMIGTLWFGVPFRGHATVLAAGVTIFLLAALGLGLFISTITATQQQAMIAAFFFILPAVTLSGFGTPISSMPPFFQKVSYFNPLTHVILVLRDVFLKGAGFEVLWPEMTAMAGFAILLLGVSVLRFRKSLE